MTSFHRSRKTFIDRACSRPVSGGDSGFGSILKKHPPSHGKTFFNTTNEAFFGLPQKAGPTQTAQQYDQNSRRQAGGHARDYESQRVRIISNLTGEVYYGDHDPQEKTDI